MSSAREAPHKRHFPKRPSPAFPLPGRAGVPVKGVSPGGAAHPIAHVYRRYEDGVCTCERAAPEGSLTLDGVARPLPWSAGMGAWGEVEAWVP